MVLSSSLQEESFCYVKSVGNCDNRNKGCLRHSPAQEKGQVVFSAQALEGQGLGLSPGSTLLAAWEATLESALQAQNIGAVS